MKYSCDITIGLPRDRVIELMDNLDNMYKWQDGLQKVEPLEFGNLDELDDEGRKHFASVVKLLADDRASCVDQLLQARD